MASWKKLLTENSSGVASVSSKLGVGTSSPSHALHVKGSGNTNQSLFLITDSDDNSQFRIDTSSADGTPHMRLYDTSGSSKVVFSSSGNSKIMGGNVGIGTDSPTQKLVVWGQVMVDNWIRGYENATAHTYERYWMNFDSGSPIYRTGSNDKYHRFENYSGTRTMSVGGSNNRVGIGTASPSAKLHVYEEGSISGRFATNNVLNYIHLTNSGGANHFIQTNQHSLALNADGNDTRGSVALMTSNTTRLNVVADGKIGIGINAPSVKLHVQNDDLANSVYDANSIVVAENDDFAFFQTASATRGGILFGDAASASAGHIVYDHTDQGAGANVMKFSINGTTRMTLSGNGPSVSNIYTPSIVAAGGDSLNMIASGVSVSIGADYDSNYGNVDIYPTGKNIGVAKTVRFNPDKSYFYKTIHVASSNIIVDGGNIGINITGTPDNPLHIENGSNGMASIRLEDARTGDTSINAGGFLDFYANHHTTNKHLGRIQYSQSGTGHEEVAFKITGTLAGVGSKKLIMNDDNGVWKFYNNYTQDEAMIIKNSQVGINTFTPERMLHLKQGADANGIRLSGHDDMANRDADIHLDSYGQLNIRNNVQSDGLANAHINFATNQGGAVYMYPQLRVGNDGISTQGAVDLKIGGNYDSDIKLLNASGNAVLTVNAGTSQVGIGTTSPTEKLEIAVADNNTALSFYRGTVADNNFLGNIEFKGNNGTETHTYSKISAQCLNFEDGAEYSDVKIYGSNGSNGLEEIAKFYARQLLMTNSGSKVGIRTASPSTALHVASGAIRLDSSQQLQFGGSATHIDGDSGYMAFDVNSAERMRIDSSGRVGIGTGSPNYKLDIIHNADEQLRVGRSGNKYIAIRDDVMQFTGMTGNGMRIQTSDNADIKFSSGTGDTIFDYAGAGGKVGIGTDSPSFGKLQVNPGSASTTGLAIWGANDGIKIQRANGSNNGAYGHITYTTNDWLHMKMNNGDNNGIGVDKIGGANSGINPANNYIQFSGYDKIFSRLGVTQFKLDAGSRISLSNNDSGTSNTIFGKSAGANLDAGSNYNVFVGENVSDASMNDASYNTAVGYSSLSALTEGDSNDSFGYNSLLSLTTGSSNTALGRDTLRTATTGASNVAIGQSSMYALTSGGNNVGIGSGSLYSNESGTNNTSVGIQALSGASGQSHSNNTGVGYQSLYAITTGLSNTAVGCGTLSAVTTGANNTAVGRAAGDAIVSGQDNSLFGMESGTSLQLGRYNSAFGYQSLNSDQHGSYSTAIGYKALFAQVHGTVNGDTGNTGVGIGAGYYNVTGTNNTYIGSQSGQGISGNSNSSNTGVGSHTLTRVTTGYSNSAMGYEAGNYISTGHENTFIGTGAGRRATTADESVGIGHYALSGALTGDANVGIGYKALALLESGVDNVAVGNEAGGAVTTGSYNIFMGDHNVGTSGMNLHTILGVPDTDRTTILGRIALHSASSDYATISHYEHRYSGTSYALRQAADGSTNINSRDNTQIYFSVNNTTRASIKGNNLGIGTTNPLERLDVRGDILSTGDITIISNQYLRADNSAGAGINSNRIKLKNHSTGNMEFTLESNSYDFAFTNGKVGIGNTNPADALDVTGGIRASGNSIFAGDLNVQGTMTVDGDFEVGTTTQFYDNVTFNAVDVDLTSSSITGLNVSVVPSALRVIESSACNTNQDVNDATEDIFWKTMSTHNTSHITWADGSGGYYFEFDTAGEYMVYCTLVVTDSASNDRLNWVTYVTHMNSSNTTIYSYGIGGGYIRDDHSPYDSAGHGGGVRLIVNANDRVKINTERLDTETTSGSAYLNTSKSKIKIDKITYSTT